MLVSVTLNQVAQEMKHGWVGHGPGLLDLWISVPDDRAPERHPVLYADYEVECWSDYEHVWRTTGIRYIWSGWVRPVGDERPDAPGVTCDRCHRAWGDHGRCTGTKPSGERCTRPYVGVAGWGSTGEDCEVTT